jgi:hypothetical protein
MVLPEIATTVSGISNRLSSLFLAVTIISSNPRELVTLLVPLEVTASSAFTALLPVTDSSKTNKDIVKNLI